MSLLTLNDTDTLNLDHVAFYRVLVADGSYPVSYEAELVAFLAYEVGGQAAHFLIWRGSPEECTAAKKRLDDAVKLHGAKPLVRFETKNLTSTPLAPEEESKEIAN